MQSKRNRIAIATVAFHSPALASKLVQLVDRYCTDKTNEILIDFILYDNATTEYSETISKYCEVMYFTQHSNKLNLRVMNKKTYSSPVQGLDVNNPSISHALALNDIYQTLCASPESEYLSILFLDHDCFPIKPFSIHEMLSGVILAGVAQMKSKLYPWAGCLAIDLVTINLCGLTNSIDFMVNEELGLDTGGELYKLIEEFENLDSFNFMSEKPESDYNIIDNTFMHFVNGSNWKNQQDHEQRLAELFNILNQKTQ